MKPPYQQKRKKFYYTIIIRKVQHWPCVFLHTVSAMQALSYIISITHLIMHSVHIPTFRKINILY